MELTNTGFKILNQLTDLVSQLSEQDFSKPAESLNHSTIGQHLRHTLEFFLCLQRGFDKGTINYDNRAHDKVMETDKEAALSVINQIKHFISLLPDKPLRLEVGYDLVREDFTTVTTNSKRELIYNIEHAVHHMAIMKIGIRELASYVHLPPDFGIAASTMRYKEALSPISH